MTDLSKLMSKLLTSWDMEDKLKGKKYLLHMSKNKYQELEEKLVRFITESEISDELLYEAERFYFDQKNLDECIQCGKAKKLDNFVKNIEYPHLCISCAKFIMLKKEYKKEIGGLITRIDKNLKQVRKEIK
jgi:hypothetical protein